VKIARIVKSLVHHIPSMNASPVSPHDGVDVVFHASYKRITVCLAVILSEEPPGRLVVPHEAVSNDLHSVPPPKKLNETVCDFPPELPFSRL